MLLFLTVSGSYQEPAKDSGWTTFTSRERDFRIDFPPGRVLEQASPITRVGATEQRTYSTRAGGCLFTVQRFRYPGPVPTLQIAERMTELKRGYLRGNVELIRDNDVTVDDVTGQQFEYRSPAPQAAGVVNSLTRHFIKGSSYYAMTVTSAPNQQLPPEADRFLDSFHFGGADRAEAGATTKGAAGAMRKAPAKGGRPPFPDHTPEDALRTFMVATARHDEPVLRVVTLPTPELGRLLQGRPAPPEAVEQVRSLAAKMKFRRLQPGDKVTLPPDREVVVGPEDIAEDRAMLLPEGSPVPIRLRRIEGHWKVDAGPIIAARKAAEAGRQKGRGQ
jgi:hypothetical protein